MKSLSLAASLLVMCIGALVLGGWIFDVAVLKSVLPTLVTMKANTAIGFVLSGLGMSLIAWREPGKGMRVVIALLAAVVAAIGLLTLCEYFFGWNLGIDQLMFHESANLVWTSHPGRMAPVTAFCFMLIAGALVAASQPIPGRLRLPILAGVGTAVGVMGALALAGCIAQGWLHASSWSDPGLALHTAFGFMLLGGVLMRLAVRQRGLRWSLDGMVTAGFAVAIAIILLAAGVSYNFTTQLLQTAGWVSHRQEVLKDIGNAAGGMANLESAQRGYIITGDEGLLKGTDEAKAEVRATLANLRKLTADNPAQQRRLDELDTLVAQRLDFDDRTIASRGQQGFPAARQMVSTGAGILLSEGIKRLFKEMQDAEYSLLDQDQKKSRVAAMSTFLILPLGVFLSLTISSLGLFFLNSGVGERLRVETAWHESEERFQTVIENLTEGVVVADLEGNVIHWNPAALAMHGFTGIEDWERKLPEFAEIFEVSTTDGEVLPLDQWPLARAIRGERLRDFVVRLRRLERDWARVFSYAGNVVREPGGKGLVFLTMFDITERARAEEALRASEYQLRSLVEQAPVAIAMLDRNLVYLAVSRRWVTEHEPGPANLIGMRHYDAQPDIPAEWREIHRRALEGTASRSDGELWVRQDGSKRWMRWAVHPWRDAHGAIGGIMILSENITDRKQAEQIRVDNVRLEAENRRVAEANRLKSEFLANMSHELRTPLNGIIGFSELLVDERPGPLNRKQKEYLGDVLNSANHLLQLINDVLDLAKVEAGKFDFQPQTFPPQRAIEEVCAVVRGLANRKQILLKCQTAPDLASVTIDEHRFKQICYNLLSNAVKFTDAAGAVEISATARDADTFEVRVTDTGIGIREADMERLFREFEQLESGASRRFEGTGLGLALTRKLAELQGGSISARSVYGKGSTFTVILPREAKEIKAEG